MTSTSNLLATAHLPLNKEEQAAFTRPLFSDWEEQLINRSIKLAFEEDLGIKEEDITSMATVSPDAVVSASLVVKQKGTLAGLYLLEKVFGKLDSGISIKLFNRDGDTIDQIPHTVAEITGKARAILAGERLALNYIQRLSGIATRAKQFVELAKPEAIQILNTRKTTPGLRTLEREATYVAGALNHRFGLSEGILIKDNHIRLAGGIPQAIAKVREMYPERIVEVETTTLNEVRQAEEAKAEIVMLDNMTPQMVAEAVAILDGKAFIEVSGGITLENIPRYLIKGVNGISIGGLTHSAPAIDISLEVEI